MRRKLGIAFAGTMLATSIFASTASAHVAGYWHFDGGYNYRGQWCLFLTSPTGHQTLINGSCQDTFGSSTKAQIDG